MALATRIETNRLYLPAEPHQTLRGVPDTNFWQAITTDFPAIRERTKTEVPFLLHILNQPNPRKGDPFEAFQDLAAIYADTGEKLPDGWEQSLSYHRKFYEYAMNVQQEWNTKKWHQIPILADRVYEHPYYRERFAENISRLASTGPDRDAVTCMQQGFETHINMAMVQGKRDKNIEQKLPQIAYLLKLNGIVTPGRAGQVTIVNTLSELINTLIKESKQTGTNHLPAIELGQNLLEEMVPEYWDRLIIRDRIQEFKQSSHMQQARPITKMLPSTTEKVA